LKKAAQKHLLRWVIGVVGNKPLAQRKKVFFASFCSQKEAFPSFP
jgi:hypothetical protein